MGRLLYGDLKSEHLVSGTCDDKWLISSLYAFSNSWAIGYQPSLKRNGDSIFYYSNKYNARGAGYLAGETFSEVSDSPLNILETISFPNVKEFEAKNENGTSVNVDFSKIEIKNPFSKEQLLDIFSNMVSAGYGGNLRPRPIVFYDFKTSLYENIKLLNNIIGILPMHIQKGISFSSANLGDRYNMVPFQPDIVICQNKKSLIEKCLRAGYIGQGSFSPEFKASGEPYDKSYQAYIRYLAEVSCGSREADSKLDDLFTKSTYKINSSGERVYQKFDLKTCSKIYCIIEQSKNDPEEAKERIKYFLGDNLFFDMNFFAQNYPDMCNLINDAISPNISVENTTEITDSSQKSESDITNGTNEIEKDDKRDRTNLSSDNLTGEQVAGILKGYISSLSEDEQKKYLSTLSSMIKPLGNPIIEKQDEEIQKQSKKITELEQNNSELDNENKALIQQNSKYKMLVDAYAKRIEGLERFIAKQKETMQNIMNNLSGIKKSMMAIAKIKPQTFFEKIASKFTKKKDEQVSKENATILGFVNLSQQTFDTFNNFGGSHGDTNSFVENYVQQNQPKTNDIDSKDSQDIDDFSL